MTRRHLKYVTLASAGDFAVRNRRQWAIMLDQMAHAYPVRADNSPPQAGTTTKRTEAATPSAI
jgi:hypothetical protein